MSHTRRSERATALLLLLLFLLSMHCLRHLLSLHGSRTIPSTENHFVQVSQDAGPSGIFAFSSEPSLQEALAAAAIPCCDGQKPEERKPLLSGERLIVVSRGGKPHILRGEMNGFFKRTLGIPLSINRESEVGLTALPNIGTDLARSIVEERSKRGGFEKVEDLLAVPGIGYQRLLKIRPFLKL
ncbi:MAG: helix-hairpin-helix domain-containing protein [Desulfobacteraceae bacterium]|nr:MAG: helix-hairpin-helix domain-containing protein [Desulfobacteraceae bacterium]